MTATHRVAHAGKYQLLLDLRAFERYVDNQFDLNRCRLVIRADGETLLDRAFVREGAKEFRFTYDRDWSAGDHEVSLEIIPELPTQPPIRQLRLRLDALTVRGPLAPEHWVQPKGYAKSFPRAVPTDVIARRAYARELIGKFATRAFRRPPAAPVLDDLVTLAEGVSGSRKAFVRAMNRRAPSDRAMARPAEPAWRPGPGCPNS